MLSLICLEHISTYAIMNALVLSFYEKYYLERMSNKNSSSVIDTKAELTELIKLKMEKAVRIKHVFKSCTQWTDC